MASEIIEEAKTNYKEMEFLIGEQTFNIKDAKAYMQRYGNVLNKLEQLERSRDNWKYKYEKIKKKLEKLPKHTGA